MPYSLSFKKVPIMAHDCAGRGACPGWPALLRRSHSGGLLRNAPVASAESARGIRTGTASKTWGGLSSQARARIFRDAARISEGRRTSVLPGPRSSMIERRRSGGVLKPSYALGQHDFLGEHRIASKQMRSGRCMVGRSAGGRLGVD
jgi:hypothetical protein